MSRPERHVDDTLTCAEVAGFVRTLPLGVHSARRLGCLRSLLLALVLTNTVIIIQNETRNKHIKPKNIMMAEVFFIGLQSRKPLLIALAMHYFVNSDSSMCCTENTLCI